MEIHGGSRCRYYQSQPTLGTLSIHCLLVTITKSSERVGGTHERRIGCEKKSERERDDGNFGNGSSCKEDRRSS